MIRRLAQTAGQKFRLAIGGLLAAPARRRSASVSPKSAGPMPRYCIDDFVIFRGFISAYGWIEQPAFSALKVTIAAAGVHVPADVEIITRPDLTEAHGSPARRWGFHARALFPARVAQDLYRDISLRFDVQGQEVVIANPGDECTRRESENCSAAQDEFLREVANPGKRVLEIGSRVRSGNSYRNIFNAAEYVGFDVMPGPNVDVVGDVHYLSESVSGKFDAVYSVSTFEHLIMPWKVCEEINKVLEIGGLVFTQSHQTWPLHDEPWDFFRFSRDSWRGLFNAATGFRVRHASYGEPAATTSLVQGRNSATRFNRERGYLMSTCLAEKVSAPIVTFAMDRPLFDRILGSDQYPH